MGSSVVKEPPPPSPAPVPSPPPPPAPSMQRRHDELMRSAVGLLLPKELFRIIFEYGGRASVLYLAGAAYGGGLRSPIVRFVCDETGAASEVNTTPPLPEEGVWSVHPLASATNNSNSSALAAAVAATGLLAIVRAKSTWSSNCGAYAIDVSAAVAARSADVATTATTTTTAGARAVPVSLAAKATELGILSPPAAKSFRPSFLIVVPSPPPSGSPDPSHRHIPPEWPLFNLFALLHDWGRVYKSQIDVETPRRMSAPWHELTRTDVRYTALVLWAKWQRVFAWTPMHGAANQLHCVNHRVAGRTVVAADDGGRGGGKANARVSTLSFLPNDAIAACVVHSVLFLYGVVPHHTAEQEQEWGFFSVSLDSMDAHENDKERFKKEQLFARRCAPPPVHVRGRTLVPAEADNQVYLIGAGVPVHQYDIESNQWITFEQLRIGGEYRSAVALPL